MPHMSAPVIEKLCSSMNNQAQVDLFKSRCRSSFDAVAQEYALKECIVCGGTYINPFKVRFKNPDIFIGFEGIHWGFGLLTTFGATKLSEPFTIEQAICYLDGLEKLRERDAHRTSGYQKILALDIDFITQNLSFFLEGRFKSVTSELNKTEVALRKFYGRT